ncbi:hypothetical protein BOX15_Mlig030038g1, partial [Macrostomum lignano]
GQLDFTYEVCLSKQLALRTSLNKVLKVTDRIEKFWSLSNCHSNSAQLKPARKSNHAELEANTSPISLDAHLGYGSCSRGGAGK